MTYLALSEFLANVPYYVPLNLLLMFPLKINNIPIVIPSYARCVLKVICYINNVLQQEHLFHLLRLIQKALSEKI